MLTQQTRLRLNSQEVAAKVMDGEAIIINLSNGIYYSMDRVGGLLWELLEKGHNLDEIASTVSQRYDVTLDEARADAERVIAELLEEKLLVEASEVSAPELMPYDPPETREAYEAPKLNIYRDMGALLALDPPMPGLEATPWKGSGEEPAK